MTHSPSPFAVPFPVMPVVPGVQLATAHTGMRYKNRDDVMLAVLAEGTQVAGVFTRNTMPGAPVTWCRKILPRGTARALLVNAGYSNVLTPDGDAVCQRSAAEASALLGCAVEDVYLSSTGIIGQSMDVGKLVAQVPTLHKNLATTAWEACARAILTTDTFAKGATATAQIDGMTVTLNGFIKGSGMIAPNMATMLGYVFTDANIPASVLQTLLQADVAQTYHCITVDSDTSTSDTILVFATGQAKHAPVTDVRDARLADFKRALRYIHTELATQVVKDGEGVKKFITIDVRGAAHDDDARQMGLSIANSPLVKTAIAGEDANWGRIAMAMGKSGAALVVEKTAISIGGTPVMVGGLRVQPYDEAPVAAHLKTPNIHIEIDAGTGGDGAARIWTIDLTHGYIDINADYRS